MTEVGNVRFILSPLASSVRVHVTLKAITKKIYKIICQLGLPKLMHKCIAENDLTIITYHGIVDEPLKIFDWCFLDKDSFREQIVYLKNHFNVVQLSKAIELILNGQLKTSTAVITFDDGFQNNFDVAYPILKEAGVPATIFISTGYVDTDDTIWFCRLNQAFNRSYKRELFWNGHCFNIEGVEKKYSASSKITVELKALPHPRLIKEVKSIISQLGDNFHESVGQDSPYRMLRSDAIKDMNLSGLIEFGAHTHNHAILSRLDPNEKQREIEKSVLGLEKITEKPCKLFSYPNGNAADFDIETLRILEALGINAAVSTVPGPNFSYTPLLQLRRYSVGADTNIEQFKTIVHHLDWTLKKCYLNKGCKNQVRY